MAASRPRISIIAVDVNPATRSIVTGTENFTREVSSRLPRAAPDLHWRFLASRPRADLGMDVTVLPFRRLWSQVRLPIAMARDSPDLLFVPGHVIPFAWPGNVLTVVHDLAFERHPEAYSWSDRAYLRMTTHWAVARCPLLITVSESTKDDLVELYGVSPDRIRVVPLGISTAASPAAPSSRLSDLGLNGTFVLQVGRVERRKNQLAALAAVEKLDGVTLVVAGPERDQALADQLRSSPRCRVLGRVSQAVLELLYKRAGAVIVPSLYEGFGLPVLEAMARGRVVVAARSSSLPEVGGDAVVYFHPTDSPAQIAGILNVALTDDALRAELGRLAKARARKFTWDRTANGVVSVIRELVSS